jgi:SAM-dependent methyltransferase
MAHIDAVQYPKYNRPRKVGAYNCLTRNYRLLSQLPFPTRIFDIGCGVGDTTKLLTFFNHVVQVLAIDKSPDLIAVADCFNDDLRIKYELADIEDLRTLPKSIDHESFDLITSFRSLHKIDNLESTMQNIKKMLKSGGYFICTLPLKANRRDLDLNEFLNQSKKWRSYYRLMKQSILEKSIDQFAWENESDPSGWFGDLLMQNGFEIERCDAIEEEIAIGDEEALEYLKMNRLRHLNVPENEYEEFVDQAYQAYSKSCRRLNGGYVNWSFDTIDVVARKI